MEAVGVVVVVEVVEEGSCSVAEEVGGRTCTYGVQDEEHVVFHCENTRCLRE